MDPLDHPLMNIQTLVFMDMGDKYLDWYALKESWSATISPVKTLAFRRVGAFKDATKDILSSTSTRAADKFVTVKPSDFDGKYYSFTDDDGENVSFDDNNPKMEFADRHPGTSEDSDCEEGVDPHEKYPNYRMNEATSPIMTTASRYLFSVAFDSPGENPLEMKAAYKHQMSLRIDEARKCLNLDCYEYKPTCLDLDNENNPPLPTNRDVEKFNDIFNPRMKSGWDSDSDDEEENEGYKRWLDKTVEAREGVTFGSKDILQFNNKAMTGKFVNSRCLRVRLPLSSIVGIRLMAATDESADNIEDLAAVLIIETNEHLGGNAFAARKVRSKFHGENSFASVSDWTPRKMASKATRYYFYGNLLELKRTAALMTKLCPNLAAMLASGTDESNTLKASVSAEYGTAPLFEANEKQTACKDEPTKKKSRTMTVKDVHKALVDANLVDSLPEAKAVNACLKKAILLGFIEISPSTTKETVIHTGSCVYCDKSLNCTMGDALFQTTYAGLDYENGGQDAGVKCESCDPEDGVGGNYITGLCCNKFTFDNGKFHNHCTQCPDFGVCIHDYREAHCEYCHNHYFQGLSGFGCQNCGGGKIKPLSQLPPPPLRAWDGKVPNSEEVWEAMLERETDPMKKMMLKMMMSGPDASFDGSEVMGMMSGMMSAFMGSQMDRGRPRGRNDEEECIVM